ncbi:MAG: hypothetical protein U0361_12160 [Nitrospiraceae bacterium]
MGKCIAMGGDFSSLDKNLFIQRDPDRLAGFRLGGQWLDIEAFDRLNGRRFVEGEKTS